MLEMVRSSIILFLRGKLFADPGKAYTQLAIGILLTALTLVILAKFAPLPLWAAAVFAGLVGGAIQPYLFRNLRYR